MALLGSLVGPPGRGASRPPVVAHREVAVVPLELTSVADDEVVFHDGDEVHRFDGLAPDTEHTFMGIEVRTLPRPERRAAVPLRHRQRRALRREVCGIDETFGSEPVFRSEPGEPPYPEMMNSGAIAEIAAIDPAAVIVKGDLTADGHDEEYAAFRQFYGGAFGDRLHTVRGNHDGYRGQTYESGDREIVLPGVRVLLLDTVIPFQTTGRITREQLAWVDDLAASSDRPVMVMGHHHPWSPDSSKRSLTYFGINPDDSEGLVDRDRAATVDHRVLRRAHPPQPRAPLRARRARFPYVEVACVKDYPGHVGRVPRVRGRCDPGAPSDLDARSPRVEREDARDVRRASTASTRSARSATDASCSDRAGMTDVRLAFSEATAGFVDARAVGARRRVVVAGLGRVDRARARRPHQPRPHDDRDLPRRPDVDGTISLAGRTTSGARCGVATPALHDAIAERGRQAGIDLGEIRSPRSARSRSVCSAASRRSPTTPAATPSPARCGSSTTCRRGSSSSPSTRSTSPTRSTARHRALDAVALTMDLMLESADPLVLMRALGGRRSLPDGFNVFG